MSNESVFAIVVSLGASVVSGVALYKLSQNEKQKKELADKIGTSVKRLEEMTEVEVTDAMLRQAIEKVVEKETVTQVKAAVSEITADHKADLRKKTTEAVADAKDKVEEDVEAELERKVRAVDIEAMIKRVEKKVASEAASKVDKGMNDLMSEYKNKIRVATDTFKTIESVFNSAASK